MESTLSAVLFSWTKQIVDWDENISLAEQF